MEASEPEYGRLLTLLSDLERSGHEGAVRRLRERVRVAVRERPLTEVRQEIALVRRAAEALRQPS